MIEKFRDYRAFSLSCLLVFFSTLLNFVLTESPYSALHSGRTNVGLSESFYLNPAYLLIGVLLVVFIYKKDHSINRFGIALSILILITLILNFKYSDINSYFYDIISIVLVASIAAQDAKNDRAEILESRCDYDLLKKATLYFVIIGFLLVGFANGNCGYLWLEMSRDNRGEITMWIMLNLPIFLLSLSLIDKIVDNNSKLLLLAFIVMIINILGGSRTPLMTSAVCLFFFFYSRIKNKKVVAFLLLIMLLLLSSSSYLKNIFFLGNDTIDASNISDVLNGRYELWWYYWNVFVDNWLFGTGPNILTEQDIAYLGASSEIGILKTATSYGVLFASIEIYIIIVGIKKTFQIFRNPKIYSKYTILVCFLFVSSSILIVQQHARIQNFLNFIFWYSMFYIYNVKPTITNEND